MADIVNIITDILGMVFPEFKPSIEERISLLQPFFVQAYYADLSPSEAYAQVTGTTLTLPNTNFYSNLNRVYAHLDKATAIQDIGLDERINIADMAQENRNLESRFWGRVSYSATNIYTGETVTGYTTAQWDTNATKGDLLNDIQATIGESFESAGLSLDSVNLEEIYKRY